MRRHRASLLGAVLALAVTASVACSSTAPQAETSVAQTPPAGTASAGDTAAADDPAFELTCPRTGAFVPIGQSQDDPISADWPDLDAAERELLADYQPTAREAVEGVRRGESTKRRPSTHPDSSEGDVQIAVLDADGAAFLVAVARPIDGGWDWVHELSEQCRD